MKKNGKYFILGTIIIIFILGIYFINNDELIPVGEPVKEKTDQYIIDENNSAKTETQENNIKTTTKKNNTKSKKIIDAKKEYYCVVEEMELNGNICSITVTAEPLVKTYYCEKGEVVGASCNVSRKEYFTPSAKYGDNADELNFKLNCSFDGGFSEFSEGSWKCYNYISEYIDATPVEYYCTRDYKLIDNKCIYTASSPASFKYVCPNGYTLNGSSCKEN